MSRELTIGPFTVNDESDAFVIAEIGHNHQGSLEQCKKLFLDAKHSGVQAVKLQKRDNRTLYTAAMYAKPYENENSYGATYGEHREFLEFGREQYQELVRYARELDLLFFSTAFDLPSADFLEALDMPLYKIASGDLRNTPLLKHVASFGKPMILSAGAATMEDVDRAVNAVLPLNRRLAVLQCTATYPTVAEDLNLRVITTLRERYPDLVIGLSDHYNGIAMGPVAYVLGARIFEKHFTFNHTAKGTDHALSLEPPGMHKFVRDLQRTRLALGDGVKVILKAEEPAVAKMGKKLVAARDLPAGHVLTAADVAIKSPGDGLPPYHWDGVIGKKLTRAVKSDDTLAAADLAAG